MKHILIFTTILFLTSCSSLQTDWNFNRGIDFSKYETYSWVDSDSKESGNKFNDLTHQEVVKYIEETLESKGLKKSKNSDSDVHVNYMINVSHKTIDTRYSNYYSSGGVTAYSRRGYAPYGYYGSSGPFHTKRMNYQEASFVIDLLDKHTRGIAWRGHASKTVDQKKNLKEQLESIKSAVDKLFRNYPPSR
jgi:hypothetical protein